MAVIGLLKTAHEVSSIIARLVSSKKNGSEEIRDVKTTVDNLRSVLLQLQLLLLSHGKIDERRSSMILVDEVVVTLTACVMTFSELDSCVEGLESDESLGILGSVRWASKSAELRKYKQNLEAHKTSLSLMVNILSCQSAHYAANDAAELKVMMVRVLDSNKALAERMSMLESLQWQQSIDVRRDHDSTSAFGKSTITELDADAPEPFTIDGPKGHPAFAFEEDLSKSWVYQRSLIRGPRTFSLATLKTQVTQSWSLLSGISLSQISNIAMQSLPIFQDDLKDNHLYAFEDVDHADYGSRMNPDYPNCLPLSEKEPSVLRKRARIPNFYPAPSLPQLTARGTQSNEDLQEKGEMPKIDEKSPNESEFLLPKLDFSMQIPQMSSLFENMSKAEAKPAGPVLHHSSGPESRGTAFSALDTTWNSSKSPVKKDATAGSFKVWYIAASLFVFNSSATKSIAGYRYLKYEAGEVFDVIGENGELWLAVNQDDRLQEIGWIWCKHFARLQDLLLNMEYNSAQCTQWIEPRGVLLGELDESNSLNEIDEEQDDLV